MIVHIGVIYLLQGKDILTQTHPTKINLTSPVFLTSSAAVNLVAVDE